MRFTNAGGVSGFGRFRILPNAPIQHLDDETTKGKGANFLFEQTTIFDPIPRVAGIEPSDDPLLELRAAVYLISGRRRRKAEVANQLGT